MLSKAELNCLSLEEMDTLVKEVQGENRDWKGVSQKERNLVLQEIRKSPRVFYICRHCRKLNALTHQQIYDSVLGNGLLEKGKPYRFPSLCPECKTEMKRKMTQHQQQQRCCVNPPRISWTPTLGDKASTKEALERAKRLLPLVEGHFADLAEEGRAPSLRVKQYFQRLKADVEEAQ